MAERLGHVRGAWPPASAGWGAGRPAPHGLERRLPLVERHVAVRPRSPVSMAARRTIVDRHLGGLGHRVGHHPGQRPLAQLTGEQPADELRLRLGRPGEEVDEQRVAGGDGARPRGDRQRRTARRRARAPSTDGSVACATSTPNTVRQPTPMRPCRGTPVRRPTATSTSSAARSRRSATRARTLAVRDLVAATLADVATRVASSMAPWCHRPSMPRGA